MILALETATDVCSVALERDGTIDEKRSETRGSHSENMFLFIRELMQVHSFSIDKLDAVLVSAGPGSYTGLRIAASGVKGLLFGSETPLISVSTLASFAWRGHRQAPDAYRIHAVINARRRHLYHQSFVVENDKLIALSDGAAKPITAVEKMVEPADVIIGTGLHRFDEELLQGLQPLGLPAISARTLIDFYNQRPGGPFIHKVAVQAFDPRYYSTGQVE